MIGSSQIGVIELLAKIDTSDYKKGAKEIDKTNKEIGDSTEQHTSRAGGAYSKFSGLAKLALFSGATAAVSFGVSAVKSFMESENVAAQLNATLKSTGGIAGVTAEQATKLASSLQKVSKFSDEEILSGENLLLTFTKIGKDIFPEATRTMLDMSQALGQDVKSSAIQLGKALQDPILGVTALRRVGVNFNEEQQKVIKNLVETGRSAEAQRLILKELSTEFGGSASAAADTYAGKIAVLKNRFDDFKESAGKVMIDVLGFLTGGFGSAKNQAQQFINIGPPLVNVVTAQATAVTKQKDAQNALNLAQQNEIAQRGALVTAKQNVATAQGQLNTAIQNYGANSEQARVATENLELKQGSLALQESITGKATDGVTDAKWRLHKANDELTGKTKDLESAQKNFKGTLEDVFTVVDSTGKHVSAQFRPLDVYIGKLQEAVNSGALVINSGGFTTQKGLTFGGNAAGTDYWKGGMTWVGEKGPELVNLPRGSQVIPNHKISSAPASVVVNVSMAGVLARSRSDLRDVAKDLVGSIDEELRAKGMATIMPGAVK